MEFGDILDQWDELRKRSVRSGKERDAAAPPAGASGTKPPASKSSTIKSAASKSAAGSKGTGGDAKSESKGNAQRSDATRTARSAVQDAQRRWMAQYGIEDKDASLAAFRAETLHKHLSRREIDALPYDAILDLHGMTALAAEEALERFFFAAVANNSRKVLLIHGKGIHSRGGPVLADIVRRWLERHPSAGRSGQADNEDGGSGATWVLLKQLGDENQRSR